MSHRKPEPRGPIAHSNVVVLQPPGGAGKRGGAKGTRGAPVAVEITSQTNAMTHDGLNLLRAFLAIEDAAARASLIILAQKLALHAPKV